MTLQGHQDIVIPPTHDPSDLLQRQVQFAIKEDLLQAEQGFFPIVAVAVRTHSRRLEKPDFIVMMQSAGGDTGGAGKLFDG
jgi:hypothetical protein